MCNTRADVSTLARSTQASLFIEIVRLRLCEDSKRGSDEGAIAQLLPRVLRDAIAGATGGCKIALPLLRMSRGPRPCFNRLPQPLIGCEAFDYRSSDYECKEDLRAIQTDLLRLE